MRRSLGYRFIIVGVLTLLMVIPLILASEVINSRKDYSRDAMREVGREWGGPQIISGPTLVVPVQETVDRVVQEQVTDPATGEVRTDAQGNPVMRSVTRRETVWRNPIYVNPGRYDVTIDTETEMRHRGIFNVPVYRAGVEMAFDFPTDQIAEQAPGNEVVRWDASYLTLNISSNAALRGEAVLTVDGEEVDIEPLASAGRLAGVTADVGDPRELGDYRFTLGLNGAQTLKIAPVGRQTAVTINSDWPHPSFTGGFLPDGSTITDDGFEARWTIPHLARTLPQVSRSDYTETMRDDMAFGVEYYEPNDFYQKAFRAAKYGILFIALTFLTVLLIDRHTTRPAHPVQYILIGLSQSIFVLLMVAYAEQIGFGLAYALSAAATILLISMFGWFGLKLGARTMVLFVMLVVLYAVLYLILQSTDYALIAGSTLAFIALAATMWMTRDEDWYGPEEERRKAKRDKAPPPAPTPAP
ncbi:cell envelope integrity protein CreD [Maritimibacter sp. UBA3975]|uniref:cell envelope integrity protein CreD n=1 Tax=Maritimibacter sp. UBA3975 TaxID=1946833 RepID=UPI000C0AD422|nr:cell envelope integrity protein CreD [Maritimibacter sp. UBA3975]MAM62070.1 cell envelope integrity protein CreD [Maritimibacter sp.]|tara:strand:+ start:8488 stop:9900 length:1413 start_codon:yes stop_codon:yes gene_type:complete